MRAERLHRRHYPAISQFGMSRNEAQTRTELIDVALEKRGWKSVDIRLEVTAAPVDIIEGRGYRRPRGRADYVLCRPLTPGTAALPLAIIEAKREGLPPEHGLQQGRGYCIGALHHVPFVFASNGHLFVEYDEATWLTSDERPLSDFPTPEKLTARYLAARGLTGTGAELAFLTTDYAQGRDSLRYYQDAAIRSALEQIIRARVEKRTPKVLLSLATGAGKTRLAAALLRRLFDAGLLAKALFVCDRTELRDNGLGDFQQAFGNDAAEVDTAHPQKNARVLIATYQTLDHEQGDAAFFQRHYPPGFFDVIVIDECHRSEWSQWHYILESNANAVQVGLTATPRQLRLPENADAATLAKLEEEKRLLGDNHRYFGEPAYEYPYHQGVADGYLAPAELETYEVFHDAHTQSERVRGVARGDLQERRLTDALTGAVLTPEAVPAQSRASALEQWIIMPRRVALMCEHLFARLIATSGGDASPEQKTIIFCQGDAHADAVTKELNNLYAHWCREHGRRRVATFAFKCMASVNGQQLIPDFRSRQRSHFIATTKELLSTGVNVPCVRNIVFFRFLESAILFHQMIGRGTRIDEVNGKLMFRIFDYTDATTLFGTDFLTPPPPPEPTEPPEPPPTPPPPRPRVRARGGSFDVRDTGNFNLLAVDGRLHRVTPQQYREKLIAELVALAPSLADFRSRWLDREQRHDLLTQLTAQGLQTAKLREGLDFAAYDDFDLLAALAYGIEPRTRAQRTATLVAEESERPAWLLHLPPPSARVIRAIARQFERGGTDALETQELWRTGEVQQAGGLRAMSTGGEPAELLQKTKQALFVA